MDPIVPRKLPTRFGSPRVFCFCGRKAVKAHEFLFCSITCAREDALQSLDESNGHYRKIMQNVYAHTPVPEFPLHHMASAGHLRPPRNGKKHPFALADPLPQESDETLTQVAPWTVLEKDMAAFPANSSKGPTQTGMPVVHSGRPVLSRAELALIAPWTTKEDTVPVPRGYPVPRQDHIPPRPLRRVPSAIDGHNTKKSRVAQLLNFGRSRRDKELENFEMVYPPGDSR